MRRTLAVAFLIALLAGAVLSAPAAAAAKKARPPARWVRVSVATLWVRPGETRSVDAKGRAYPADPRAWIAGLTTTQKRWLVGRLETQAPYGAKVYLLGTRGSWSRVVVAGQPTSRHGLGYPGWVPTRQLTETAPPASEQVAVVLRPTAWLFETVALDGRVLELSYGTRLPVLSVSDAAVEVARPEGGSAFLRRQAVKLHTVGDEWPTPTRAELVAEARRFRGLQYLWGGTSGFGLDCSGFTHLVYKAFGITIPRDAGDQSKAGRRVAKRSKLRKGDLVFFKTASGVVHHVGMYVGNGKMIHAPGTGRAVGEVSLRKEPYRSEFAGGRRLVP